MSEDKEKKTGNGPDFERSFSIPNESPVEVKTQVEKSFENTIAPPKDEVVSSVDPIMSSFVISPKVSIPAKMRKKKFYSLFKVIQSHLSGKDLFLVPTESCIKIGPFTNKFEFDVQIMNLMLGMDPIYDAIQPSVDDKVERSLAKVTDRTSLGMDVRIHTLDEGDNCFIRSDINYAINEAFFQLTNIVIPDSVMNHNSANGPTTTDAAQLKSRDVCMLEASEKEFLIQRELAYLNEYFINVLDYVEYLRLFGESQAVRKYLDITNRDQVIKNPNYKWITFRRANNNGRNCGDVFRTYRTYLYYSVANVVKQEVKELLSFSKPDWVIELTTAAGMSNTKETELKKAKDLWSQNKSDDTFFTICTAILMGRWFRLDDGVTSLSFSLARIGELIMRRAVLPMCCLHPSQIRNDEIYMIVNFFSCLDPLYNDHLDLYSFIYWNNDPIDHPTQKYFDLVEFDPLIDSAVKSFFRVDKMGSGYLGGGMNPSKSYAVPDAARFFTNKEEIEPVTGFGYVPQVDPPQTVQADRYVKMLNALIIYLRRSTRADSKISNLIDMLSYFSRFSVSINYYAQILERIKYFWCLTSAVEPGTDNEGFVPTLDNSGINPQIFQDVEKWAKLNYSVMQQNIAYGFNIVHLQLNSIVPMIMSLDWVSAYKQLSLRSIPFSMVDFSLALTQSLLMFGESVALSFSYGPLQWGFKDRMTDALQRWNSPFKSIFLRMFEEKNWIGYPPLIGSEYAYKKWRDYYDFINSHELNFGFIKSFYLFNGKMMPLVAPEGFRLMNTVEPILDVTSFNHFGLLKTRFDLSAMQVGRIYRIDVPIGLVYPTEFSLHSNWKYETVSQECFDFYSNKEYGYEVKKFQIVFVLDDEDHIHAAARTTVNPNCAIEINPYKKISIDDLKAMIGTYDCFRKVIDFSEYIPTQFWTGAAPTGTGGKYYSFE